MDERVHRAVNASFASFPKFAATRGEILCALEFPRPAVREFRVFNRHQHGGDKAKCGEALSR